MEGEFRVSKINLLDHPVVMDGQHLLEVPHEICVYRAEPAVRTFEKTVDTDRHENIIHSAEYV